MMTFVPCHYFPQYSRDCSTARISFVLRCSFILLRYRGIGIENAAPGTGAGSLFWVVFCLSPSTLACRLSMKNAPNHFLPAASDQSEIVSLFLLIIDCSSSLSKAPSHHLRSLLALLDIRLRRCPPRVRKYICLLYSQRRKVRPSGVTMQAKLRYQVSV